jgi:hypothetical protein
VTNIGVFITKLKHASGLLSGPHPVFDLC